jgi:hypothetical protein
MLRGVMLIMLPHREDDFRPSVTYRMSTVCHNLWLGPGGGFWIMRTGCALSESLVGDVVDDLA